VTSEQPAAPRRGAGRSGGRSWAGLLALLALFAALHALYNLQTPLGEGPDEPGHLAYVFFLAREGRLPVQRPDGAGDVPGEGHQPPLAYLLAAPAALALPPAERVVTLSADPGFVWAGGDSPAAFRRGSRELWPWQGIAPAWHLARAVSGLWGLLTVALTFLAARALRPGDGALPLLAAALVALNPQFLFSTALVSNDGLLAALCTAALWLCLGARGADPAASPRMAPWWRFVALGALFGLALITKQSALLLGPLLLWAGWRASPGDQRRFVALTLIWGLTAVAVAGWWFLRNWRLYGDPLGLAVFTAEFATQAFAWREPAAWRTALAQLFASFWARFGWMSVRPPDWTIWAYGGLCALGGVGWLVWGRGQGDKGTRGPPGRANGWAGVVILLAMALLWNVAFALTAGLVAWQGRLVFPAIAAVGLLLAGGLRAFAGPGARGAANSAASFRLLFFGFGVPMLALALWMPFGVIAPAYRWDVLGPGEAEALIERPAYARFAQSWERGVALRGWRSAGPTRAGEPLAVHLVWHSLEPVPRDWTVFVHLVAPDGRIAAESNSRPRGGALPFPAWTPGDWVDDRHALPLPAGLPPGEYRLVVGLYQPERDDRRQAVWGADGAFVGDNAEVGTVEVTGGA